MASCEAPGRGGVGGIARPLYSVLDGGCVLGTTGGPTLQTAAMAKIDELLRERKNRGAVRRYDATIQRVAQIDCAFHACVRRSGGTECSISIRFFGGRARDQTCCKAY